jgi:hypothetical protein
MRESFSGNIEMPIATVSLEALTERVNRRLKADYRPNTVSQARKHGIGHPGLILAIKQETASMLQEAADAAKAEVAQ